MMEPVQRTKEWLNQRLGMVTASRVADIVARTKSGYSASRANYLAQLVTERLTGTPGEAGGINTPAIQWGINNEWKARAAYTFYTDRMAVTCGMIPHPTIEMAAASPDGLVGEDGLIEIKCPNTATHIETMMGRVIPARYEIQMFWQMACTGRAWCDFVSFDPRLPPKMQLYVARLKRNPVRIAELEAEVKTFLEEVATTVEGLQALFDRPDQEAA